MNVKLNDNVLVIAGKDKGKQGKVLATSPKADTVTVEGVRMQKKHEKARKANETSKIVEKEGAISASNVMVMRQAHQSEASDRRRKESARMQMRRHAR